MSRIAFASGLLAAALVVACGGDDDDDNILDQATEEPEETATPAGSPTEESAESPTEEATTEPSDDDDEVYGPDDCPIEDEPFCEVAVQVANALVEGDTETIAGLSLEQQIDCNEVAVEAFPECAPDETLSGYVTSGPQGENSVRSRDDYTAYIADLLDSVVDDASDAVGSGEMRVLVVGPRGDGYDMIATAIIDSESEGETRWFFFISFDQTEELDWLIRSWVDGSTAAFADAGFLNPATDLLPAPEPWGSGE